MEMFASGIFLGIFIGIVFCLCMVRGWENNCKEWEKTCKIWEVNCENWKKLYNDTRETLLYERNIK